MLECWQVHFMYKWKDTITFITVCDQIDHLLEKRSQLRSAVSVIHHLEDQTQSTEWLHVI